ncbi:NOP protein chaperone 1 [Scleropages formosus]|uniref:NOP protein chaperone 1 n=1 Tax=Scleropages formosus TaxID=113540 RepID=A0A8C9T344_SCLFO|nr:uncharacterized protein C12orf45 homolog [Scleropages formosus]
MELAEAPLEQKHEAEAATSRDLLLCGNGGGLRDTLLIKSKPSKKSGSLQTTHVPRSNVLDRLQRFLPQIAQANEKLRLEMESSPAGRFDIENVEELEKVIEMDVALVELGDSDSETEEETSDDSSSTDSEEDSEVTENNLKLPGERKKGKANITVVQGDAV